MSTATVHRRNGKPMPREAVPTVSQAIEETATDATVEVQALALITPNVVVMDRKALLEAYESSFERSVNSIGGILDNTALTVYCQVGPTASTRSVVRRICLTPNRRSGLERMPSQLGRSMTLTTSVIDCPRDAVFSSLISSGRRRRIPTRPKRLGSVAIRFGFPTTFSRSRRSKRFGH